MKKKLISMAVWLAYVAGVAFLTALMHLLVLVLFDVPEGSTAGRVVKYGFLIVGVLLVVIPPSRFRFLRPR